MEYSDISDREAELDKEEKDIKMRYIFAMAARVVILLFFAVIVLSAFIYGAYDSLKRNFMFNALRSAACGALVLLVMMFFISDSYLDQFEKTIGDTRDIYDISLHFIPIMLTTAAMVLFSFLAKPKRG